MQNIKRNPENAASLKMEHFSNIGVNEVFLEATPTTFITTVILLTSTGPTPDEGLSNVLVGSYGSRSFVLFYMGYVASILSSAFGVSRYFEKIKYLTDMLISTQRHSLFKFYVKS